jgi:hypothetical protein
MQPDAAQSMGQRRRAAQAGTAGEAAPPVAPALGGDTLQPGTPATAGPGTVFNIDPAWNDAYERMRQSMQPAK